MMKKILMFLFLLCFKSISAQQNLQLLPEFTLNNPLGNFSQDNFGAQQGFGGGLHLDRLNIWKGFGFGLHVGYNQNESEYSTLFPNVINDAGFASRVLVDAKELNWKSLQIGIGPMYSFNLSDKFSFQAYSKFGFAKVSYPEYRYYVNQTQPVQQEYTLFQTSEPEGLDSNFRLMLLSGLRGNYKLSNRFGVSLGVSYLHIKDVVHTYTTRDAVFTETMSSTELFETLNTTETTTKIYECNINSINATIGITISFGGGSSPPEEPEEQPDIPIEPNEPEENYNCERVIYEAPGYNDYVVLSEAPYVFFQWTDENSRRSKEEKSYQLVFLIKENGEYKEVDRRIMNTKRRFKIGLNPNKSYPDNALYWKIIPLDENENEFCPEPSKLMRLLVFKDKAEALVRLPQCLTVKEDVINQPANTNFFKKPKSKKDEKN